MPEAATTTNALGAGLAIPAEPAPWAAYLHIPFCKVRCGYCDFNTYTVGFGPGADRETYQDSLRTEIRLARNFLDCYGAQKIGGETPEEGFSLTGLLNEGEAPSLVERSPLRSVYFGGGTPTLLPAAHLVNLLEYLRSEWGIASGAEVSIEANPDTVTAQLVEVLAAGGFTRVSLGMQSAVPKVLKTLDRTHNPKRLGEVVRLVQNAGLQASVDLIYGTPGESYADWEESLDLAVATGADHISAYSLVIEPGTKMGRQLAKKEIPPIDPDEQAEKYVLADKKLAAAGYAWYEISNWAKLAPGEHEQLGTINLPDATALSRASQHNLAYWRDWNWWGFGPGAHSHLDGCRWWNGKHPRAYAQQLGVGKLPIQDGEKVDSEGRQLEKVMLAIRTASGLTDWTPKQAEEIKRLTAEGLVDEGAARSGRAVLTLAGRLLADLVTLRLTE